MKKENSSAFKSCIFIVTALCVSCLTTPVNAKDFSLTKTEINHVVDVIYLIEGAEKAKKPFGILSVPCNGYDDCRQVCYNTVKNNIKRYNDYGYKTHDDYYAFLASRYAPEEAHPLNKNWLPNLKRML